MKILVTGGAGFIGSNFIHYWLSQHPGDEITNLDLLTYAGNLNSLADIASLTNYRFCQGDIADQKLVNELVAGQDLIVHFAAESHVDRSIKDSASFVRTNVEGTRTLLEAARLNGLVRFHHISTDEVFGSLSLEDQPFSERTPYDPRSPYSASKAAADHLVRAYFHTYGLPITISNCSNNYGPYQYPEKFIPLAITNLLRGRKIPLYGSGQNIRDWIHVADHNRGVEAIIRHGKIGETYCLGGNGQRTNQEIVALILEVMGKTQADVELVSDRPGHDLRYAIDFSKAERELGWQPTYELDAGLRETVEWYRHREDWWRDLVTK